MRKGHRHPPATKWTRTTKGTYTVFMYSCEPFTWWRYFDYFDCFAKPNVSVYAQHLRTKQENYFHMNQIARPCSNQRVKGIVDKQAEVACTRHHV